MKQLSLLTRREIAWCARSLSLSDVDVWARVVGGLL